MSTGPTCSTQASSGDENTVLASNSTTLNSGRNFQLIGVDRQLDILRNAVRSIGSDDTPSFVFIQGPSGTGKTALVSSVRQESSPSDGSVCPFWAPGKFHQRTNSTKSFSDSELLVDDPNQRPTLPLANTNETRPYSAIIAAITELCDTIISRPRDSMLQDINSRLESCVSENEAAILVTVVPAIASLKEMAREEKEEDEKEVNEMWAENAKHKKVDLAGDEESDEDDIPTPTGFTLRLFLGLFRRLLLALSSPLHPIVLFLDDLQWADEQSKTLIQALLHGPPLPNVLLVGVVCDDTMQDDDQDINEEGKADCKAAKPRNMLGHLPDSLSFLQTAASWRVEELTTGPLDMEGVNELLAGRLQRHAMETRELSHWVYNRTVGGNPHLCTQCIDWLLRRGLLYKQSVQKGSPSCWVWDIEAVREAGFTTTDVLTLYNQALIAFPRPVRFTLTVAAVLGFRFSIEVLEAMMGSKELMALLTKSIEEPEPETAMNIYGELQMVNVKQALRKAVSSGLIERLPAQKKTKAMYQFSHDYVQQSAAELLTDGRQGDQARALIGSLLLTLYHQKRKEALDARSEARRDDSDSGDDFSKNSRFSKSADNSILWMLFAATNLLTTYSDTETEAIKLAKLCQLAARKAGKQAAFASAANYADEGAQLVRRRADAYPLIVELCSLSAEMHYANGDLIKCEDRIAAVQKYSRKPADTFRATRVTLQVLAAHEEWPEVINESLNGIQRLGVIRAPRSANKLSVVRQVLTSKMMLKGRTPQELDNDLPVLQDPAVLQTCFYLEAIGLASYWTAQKDLLSVVCHLLFQSALQHGIGEFAPTGIVAFGMTLCVMGQLKKAYEFSKYAEELTQRKHLRRYYAKVCIVHHAFLSFLCEPLDCTLLASMKGYYSGIEHSDVFYACNSLRIKAAVSSYVGMRLDDFHLYVCSCSKSCPFILTS